MEVDWQRLEAEVRRVHQRYQEELVEDLGLCPWAKQARRDGKVRLGISFMLTPDSSEAAAQIERIMSAEIEVGMLAFPALPLDRLPFAHFAAAVRNTVDAHHPRGQSPFALADFHPSAIADTASPERLVPFLRRAPDPLLQIVRQSVLESVRNEPQGTSFLDPSQYDLNALLALPPEPLPLAARVARSNARSVERLGVEHVDARIADILADRDANYAALGLTLPTWYDKSRTTHRNKLENPETR